MLQLLSILLSYCFIFLWIFTFCYILPKYCFLWRTNYSHFFRHTSKRCTDYSEVGHDLKIRFGIFRFNILTSHLSLFRRCANLSQQKCPKYFRKHSERWVACTIARLNRFKQFVLSIRAHQAINKSKPKREIRRAI